MEKLLQCLGKDQVNYKMFPWLNFILKFVMSLRDPLNNDTTSLILTTLELTASVTTVLIVGLNGMDWFEIDCFGDDIDGFAWDLICSSCTANVKNILWIRIWNKASLANTDFV
jgi:hypothetical protein